MPKKYKYVGVRFMPQELWDDVKLVAAIKKITVQEFVIQTLRREVDKIKKKVLA